MAGKELQKKSINKLCKDIRNILEKAKSQACRAVNFAMVVAYWKIGKVIIEEEQKGEERAKYGQFLIKELSQILTIGYGKGFTPTNLKYMRQFYLQFPKSHALRGELSWTHYRLLLKIEKELAKERYHIEVEEGLKK